VRVPGTERPADPTGHEIAQRCEGDQHRLLLRHDADAAYRQGERGGRLGNHPAEALRYLRQAAAGHVKLAPHPAELAERGARERDQQPLSPPADGGVPLQCDDRRRDGEDRERRENEAPAPQT